MYNLDRSLKRLRSKTRRHLELRLFEQGMVPHYHRQNCRYKNLYTELISFVIPILTTLKTNSLNLLIEFALDVYLKSST